MTFIYCTSLLNEVYFRKKNVRFPNVFPGNIVRFNMVIVLKYHDIFQILAFETFKTFTGGAEIFSTTVATPGSSIK